MSSFQAVRVLYRLSLLLLLAGAVGSLAMVIYTGRNNRSILLVSLFTGWVMLPYVAFYIARKISMRWSVMRRQVLYLYIILMSIASLFIYTGLVSPSGVKPSFTFLLVPLVSWLQLLAVIQVSALLAGKIEK